MRKCFFLLILLFIIVFAGIVILGGYFYLQRKTLPKTQGVEYLHGLHGPVYIYRDRFGIPHIVALKSDLDAFFALGYVQAQDRFWQMTFQRHVAKGTLSELFGKDTIKQDEFLRTLGFYRAAKTEWPALSRKAQTEIRAYTAGINAFIAQGHFPLPIRLLHWQPKRWSPIDSIVWQKVMAWDLQVTWQQEVKNYLTVKQLGQSKIAQYFPPYPAKALTTLSIKDLAQAGIISHKVASLNTRQSIALHQPINSNIKNTLKIAQQIRKELNFKSVPGKGSNAWVVSGKFTKSGMPILSNDVHLALTAPSLWYLVEMTGPYLHVYGATIPGLPGVIIGHNNNIAWGITAGYGDNQDLFIIPNDVKLKVLNETILVRDSKPVHYKVYISKHGPIISNIVPHADKTGLRLALQWTTLRPGDTTAQAFLQLQYAANWHQFVAAVKKLTAITLNVFYADTKGNIGYYYSGKLPIRCGWDGILPAPANSDDHWCGFIPFSQLPHIYNPPQGFLLNSNNKPVPNGYPYQLTFRWRVPPYRAERVQYLLTHNGKLTIKDMMRFQQDTYSEFWYDLKSILLSTKPINAASSQALNILKNWDGHMSINSKGATIFAFWLQEFNILWPKDLAFGEKWLEPLYVINVLSQPNRQSYLSNSLAAAMIALKHRLGSNPEYWQWGRVHHVVFNYDGLGKIKAIAWIWRRSITTPGGNHTIDVGTYNPSTFVQIDGPSYREVINLDRLNDSYYMQTLGQSGHVFSTHYSDLIPLWRNGQYIQMQTKTIPCKAGQSNCLVLMPNNA